MATTGELPWSDAEKLVLLAEILKDAKVSPDVLLVIIKNTRIEPNWAEIPLPSGRSLNSCQNAFRSLLEAPSPAPASRRRTIAGPQGVLPPPNGSPNSKKRPYPAADVPTTSRSIQPRPIAAALNGESPGPGEVSTSFQGVSADADPNQPPRKKRGRPTKAETEAKRQAAALKGEIYPPPKQQKTPRSSISGGRVTTTDAAGETNANVAAPLAVMTPLSSYMSTPGTAGSGMEAPGTGGKRRRGRPTKAEAAAKRALIEAATVTGGEGESEIKNDDDDGDEAEEAAEFGDDHGANKSVESTTEGNVHERLEGKTAGIIDMESGEDMHLDS
ncbi:hypothetical protein FGG08_006893 [Glutinoglossum americanum]|uniref:Uncharacterized protein n=1 Tax=Glutinoglossum americanum TaxID=1670608 RepID=A0A9P8KUH8_9PEZI|nr:hypothetical protein FGG08_006893 [Glutinoglossum americanum]